MGEAAVVGQLDDLPLARRIIKAIDERLTAYLAEMEKQDAAEPSAAGTSVEELRAKIEQQGR